MADRYLGESIKKLGFGLMRLPMLGEEIDIEQVKKMADTFMSKGFTYFDTAYVYIGGKSEVALKEAVVDRYPRDSFQCATKLPLWDLMGAAEMESTFQESLDRAGLKYYDFYLLHAMDHTKVKKADEIDAWGFMKRIKEEGRAKHIGFSFHDSAEVLEGILASHPEMEFVQLQINYADWEDDNVQSRKCYEVAKKYGVPVIVMEPVKGGTLANMTGRPAEILRELSPEASFASYAIRYAASLENVMLVLSGMSDEQQLTDNTAYMREFTPLDERERAAIARVVEELAAMPTIACTKCRYCVEGCPKKISIPDVFEDYNMTVQFGINETNHGSYRRHTADGGSADVCIRCGKCEGQCPQHLPIRDLLVKVAETFAE